VNILCLVAWTLGAYELRVVLENESKISDNDMVRSAFNRLTYDIPNEFSSTNSFVDPGYVDPVTTVVRQV
jgi:hypothetical protein